VWKTVEANIIDKYCSLLHITRKGGGIILYRYIRSICEVE
jgi:hypothetical protein